MAKLTDDQIKWILSLDANPAQQEIAKLTGANKELVASNKLIQKSMLELEAQGKKNSDEWKNLKASYDQNTASIGNNKKQMDEMVKTLGVENMTMTQLKKTAKDLQRQMDDTSKNLSPEAYSKLEKELDAVTVRMQELKGNSKSIVDRFGEMPGPIGQTTQGLKGAGQAFKAFLANPVGVILTVIVLGFTALYNILKSFAPVMDKLEQGFAALSAGFTVLKEAVIGLVTGQKTLIETLRGLGDSMKQAAIEAVNLKQAQQDLEDLQRVSAVNQSKYKNQIDELLLQSKNRTLSEKERIALIDKALVIEKQAHDENKRIADEELRLAQAKIINGRGLTQYQINQLKIRGVAYALYLQNIKGITDEEIDALKDASIKKNEIDNQSIQLREKAQNRRDQLADKEQERLNKIREEEKKLADARKKIIEDAQIIIDDETKKYNERLKASGLYGKESKDLTEEQLVEKTHLERQYQDIITAIAQDAETTRFENEKKAAGLSGDPKKIYGEKIKAYELLVMQHNNNLQKLRDENQQKDVDSEKRLQSDILNVLKTANKATLDVIQTETEAEKLFVQGERLSGRMDQEEYTKELERIELDSLAKRLVAHEGYVAILKALPNPTKEQAEELKAAEALLVSIQQQINAKNIQDLEQFEQKKKQVRQQYGLETIAEISNMERVALEKQHKEGLLSEQEYEQAKLQLKLKAAQQYTQQVGNIVSAGSDFVQSIQSAETASVQADYAERMAGLNQSDADYAAKKEQLQYEQAVAELDVQKKYADAQFAIQVAQIGVATATGIMNAWASAMTLPPPFDVIAGTAMTALLVGTGIAQVAAANSERQKIKATTIESPGAGASAPATAKIVDNAGFADGGYTGSGGKLEVAGDVHRGEYVIAQDEMQTPELVPFVRRIDRVREQRTGRRSLPSGYGSDTGFSDGGYTGNSSVAITPALVDRFEKAVDKLANTKFKSELNYWEFKQDAALAEESRNLGKRG